MTNHVARLYALAGAALTLFLAWAVIAAHPWKKAAAPNMKDARLVALAQRERLLRKDLTLVQRLTVRADASRARSQRATAQAVQPARTTAPAAAPRVRVVTLPPLVITRSS